MSDIEDQFTDTELQAKGYKRETAVSDIDEALVALSELFTAAWRGGHCHPEEANKRRVQIEQALERQRVPDECGWCDGPGPLNKEGLCVKCLYPDGPPIGWKLVPVDLPDPMFHAIRNSLLRNGNPHVMWRDALAAAPAQENSDE